MARSVMSFPGRGFQPVTENTEEISIDPGGGGAEQSAGGITINFIPKDGGNIFSGNFLANVANGSFAVNY